MCHNQCPNIYKERFIYVSWHGHGSAIYGIMYILPVLNCDTILHFPENFELIATCCDDLILYQKVDCNVVVHREGNIVIVAAMKWATIEWSVPSV